MKTKRVGSKCFYTYEHQLFISSAWEPVRGTFIVDLDAWFIHFTRTLFGVVGDEPGMKAAFSRSGVCARHK